MDVKRIVLALSAVATLVLALDKIGATPIAPGTDLGFAVAASQIGGKPALSLSADAGQLECWIHLEVDGLPVATVATAQVRGGDPLATHVSASPAGALEMDVCKGGSQSANTRPFSWPPGAAIDLVFDAPPGARPVLRDWTVYLTKGEAETKGRDHWRTAWFWISIACFAVAGMAGVWSVWPEEKVVNARDLLGLIIDGIEGMSPQETRHMRKILHKVVLGAVPLQEALDTIPGTFMQKRAIWIKAKNGFQTRLWSLIVELYRAYEITGA